MFRGTRRAETARRADLAAWVAAALALALPAAGQSPPAATSPPAAAATEPRAGEGAAVAAPVVVSPALGALSGRDTPRPAPAGEVRTGAGLLRTLGPTGAGLDASAAADRPFMIRPSIQLELQATDNVFLTRNNPRADIIALVTPGIAATVATPRLSGSIAYNPTAYFFGTYTSENRVEQFGSGRLLAAIVPGLFYVDMRAAATVVPARGGTIPGTGQANPLANGSQAYSAQVTPYLVHHFGTAATAQVGYSFQYSDQGDVSGGAAGRPDADVAVQDFTANRGFAILRTGEDFGRLALQASVDGTVFNGTGVYDNAHRFVTALEARYAILPTVALLAEIGYENLEYAGTNPGRIDGAIWSVGTRLTPSPDSTIILRYGRRDGFNSLSVNAGMAIGGRTDLYVAYSESLTTTLGRAQDLLSTTTLDALGNPVDSQTGAPVILVNPFFDASNGLFRTRNANVTLSQTWPRDVLSISATWQDRTPVSSASAQGAAATAQTGGYITFTWVHDLAPRTTTIATLQYGRTRRDGADTPDDNVYVASAALVYRLTETMTGLVQVRWARQDSDAPQAGYSQTLLRAALRRSF